MQTVNKEYYVTLIDSGKWEFIDKWDEENMGSLHGDWFRDAGSSNRTYYFDNEKDALMFALRWL